MLVVNAHAKALKRKIIVSKQSDESEEEQDQAASDIGRILNLAQSDSWTIAQFMWDNIVNSLMAPFEVAVASILLYRCVVSTSRCAAH